MPQCYLGTAQGVAAIPTGGIGNLLYRLQPYPVEHASKSSNVISYALFFDGICSGHSNSIYWIFSRGEGLE